MMHCLGYLKAQNIGGILRSLEQNVQGNLSNDNMGKLCAAIAALTIEPDLRSSILLYKYFHQLLIWQHESNHFVTKLEYLMINPFDPYRNLEYFKKMGHYLAYINFAVIARIDLSYDIIEQFVYSYMPDCIFRDEHAMDETIINILHLLVYGIGPIKVDYDSNRTRKLTYIIRKTIYNYINKNISVPHNAVDNGRVLFIMSNSSYGSSDMSVSIPFIEAFKSAGYLIDVVSHNVDLDNANTSPFSIAYTFKSFNNFSRYRYTIHVDYHNMLQYAIQATTKIGILGNLFDSGILDYYVVPEWDNENNYCEQLIKLPGMGGGIKPLYKPTSIVDITARKRSLAIPLTGMRINQKMGPIWQRINQILPDVEFNFLLGSDVSEPIKQLLETIHIKPYVTNYKIHHDDVNVFNKVLSEARVILLSVPYSAYITISNHLLYGVPIVALMEPGRFSSMCAGKMLELFNLSELVAESVDEYITMTETMMINDVYYRTLCNRILTSNYEVAQHNAAIQTEFAKCLCI